MSYIMLEGVVCVVIAAGMATLVFASSLVVMLAHEGIANAFRGKTTARSQTRHFGGREPQ
jgi:heme A synthase